jgi:hypothetical protein
MSYAFIHSHILPFICRCGNQKAATAVLTALILELFGPFIRSISIRLKTKEESLEAEKRKHPRHSVRDGGIEILTRETKITGRLENISKNGLAFRYIPLRGERAESDTIDIMATDPGRCYLSGLVCRKIYDISALDEDQTFTGAETRLCGLEFVSIENDLQLTSFLRNYLNIPAEELCQ